MGFPYASNRAKLSINGVIWPPKTGKKGHENRYQRMKKIEVISERWLWVNEYRSSDRGKKLNRILKRGG
jgi:hypothetical protein